MSVQTLLRQLTRLLNTQEQEELKTNDMFKPFKSIHSVTNILHTKIKFFLDLNILEFGQYSSNLWLKSCEQFERLLQPAEERVAAKLKRHLSGIGNPRQLLHEFTRYSELIGRPVLKQTLLSERQQLLNSLYDYVRHLQSQNTTENTLNVKNDTPQIVAEVIVTKQLEAKANEVLQTSEKLLHDLNGYENLKQIVSELLKDLKQQHNELFDSWTREVSSLIKKDILNLKESEPVVQFSQESKLMKVNYSERLVPLISEVRKFKALGYQIPNHIDETSEQAKKFMKLAGTLVQVGIEFAHVIHFNFSVGIQLSLLYCCFFINNICFFISLAGLHLIMFYLFVTFITIIIILIARAVIRLSILISSHPFFYTVKL